MKRGPVRTVLAAAVVAALALPSAHAQDDDARILERVEVVGSRIKRTDLETSQPVLVIDRDDIVRTGLVSLGDILQRITVHGSDLNSLYNTADDGTPGNGETRIDLRDLGANRTLVLVNGRRWNTTLDGAVDLNSIPLPIVERIEVLKDGASAIYGSDAIAGVVNITTRDDYAGAEANAYLGENEKGDGRIEAYDFTLGSSTDRSSVVLNASYQKQEPIFSRNRAIAAVPTFGLPPNDLRVGASSATPFGRFGFGPRANCAFRPAGDYPSSGCPTPGSTTYDPALGGYRNFSPTTDGYNYAPDNYLQTPQERTALFAQARYGLTEAISFRTELLYNERRSAQRQAPALARASTTGVNALRMTVPAAHVYNPFGQEVRSLEIRVGSELRGYQQDADTFRAGAGIDGVFQAFGRSVAFDVHATYTETSVAETSDGQIDAASLRAALGPSFRDVAGVARCGTPEATIAGCVPFDPFRGPAGFTPDMLDYLYFTSQESNARELTDYAANLTGDLFALPAGPLAFAAGYEYRREGALQTRDALLQMANTANGGIGKRGFQARSSVDEVYLELAVPLLAERPFARVLEASLAARWSDYSSFGETTNFKAGFRWKPHDDLLLRGTWSEGFRAPSLFELFDPLLTSNAPTANDPCASTRSPNATTRAGCAADGVPGGVYTPEIGFAIAGRGGNPALQPETATSRTLGAVYSPEWLDGLELLVDWFEIELDDAIVSRAAFDVLLLCIFDGVACELTERHPGTGELLRVEGRNLNLASERIEGYDVTASYRFDTSWGRWAIDWDSVYYAEHVIELPTTGERISLVGNYVPRQPGWRIRSNLGLTWRRGDFGAGLAARYYDALDEGCSLDPAYVSACSSPDISSPTFNDGPENRLDQRWYFDAQASWNAPWNAEIRGGVQNVFDEDPPVSYIVTNSFDPQYPVPGRFWYVSYTQRF